MAIWSSGWQYTTTQLLYYSTTLLLYYCTTPYARMHVCICDRVVKRTKDGTITVVVAAAAATAMMAQARLPKVGRFFCRVRRGIGKCARAHRMLFSSLHSFVLLTLTGPCHRSVTVCPLLAPSRPSLNSALDPTSISRVRWRAPTRNPRDKEELIKFRNLNMSPGSRLHLPFNCSLRIGS